MVQKVDINSSLKSGFNFLAFKGRKKHTYRSSFFFKFSNLYTSIIKVLTVKQFRISKKYIVIVIPQRKLKIIYF